MAQAAIILPFTRPAANTAPPPFEALVTTFDADPNNWMVSNFPFVRGALFVAKHTADELFARFEGKDTSGMLDEFARVENHLIGVAEILRVARNRLALVAGVEMEDNEPHIA